MGHWRSGEKASPSTNIQQTDCQATSEVHFVPRCKSIWMKQDHNESAFKSMKL
jgi:hypothetical protein